MGYHASAKGEQHHEHFGSVMGRGPNKNLDINWESLNGDMEFTGAPFSRFRSSSTTEVSETKCADVTWIQIPGLAIPKKTKVNTC
jgi:hypothetical protein